jgi:hypothetical protein
VENNSAGVISFFSSLLGLTIPQSVLLRADHVIE